MRLTGRFDARMGGDAVAPSRSRALVAAAAIGRAVSPLKAMSVIDINWEDIGEEAARILTRYIRVDTTNPPGNEADAADFLGELLSAEFIPSITFQEVVQRELAVMDAAAVSLCKENDLPIIVLNLEDQGAVSAAIRGDRVGTLVS